MAAFLFGAATPASKFIGRTLTPFQLAGLLYLGAALAVLPWVIKSRALARSAHLPRRTLLQLSGAILFGGILGPVLLLSGLRLASSASVALWLNLELVTTVALGFVIFRDPLTRRSVISASLVLIAAVMLSVTQGPAALPAAVLVFLACLSWSIDNHLTALIDGLPVSGVVFWKGLVAGTANLSIGMIAQPLHVSGPLLAGAVLLGALSYGLSIVLYISSAQQMGAVRGQIVFASAPYFAIALSALALKESITWAHWVAMGLIALSIAGLLLEEHAHRHAHPATAHLHEHSHDDDHHIHEHPGERPSRLHAHWHEHAPLAHSHVHWPDLHHRHEHVERDPESDA